MVRRLLSFLRSDSKQILLKYFYHELRADGAETYTKFLRKTGLAAKGKSGKIDLSGQKERLFGLLRNGLIYGIRQLDDLHNPYGIQLDAMVDRTFSIDRHHFRGYQKPWIGFIHIPPRLPEWMNSPQSNQAIFASQRWKNSLPHCRGLFTLCDYHRRYLEPLLPVPVETLFHPVEFPELKWSWQRFSANPDPKIVQSGWWLRRVYSFYLLQAKGYRKVLLMKQDAGTQRHMKLEREHRDDAHRITPEVMKSVEQVNFLPDNQYDQLLSENIVFIDLYDACANNAILECIARATPVLVNPLEAVVEYLGPDYPFYFQTLEEAAAKAGNPGLVRQAHQYLLDHPWKHRLTGSWFRQSFMDSKIYQSL